VWIQIYPLGWADSLKKLTTPAVPLNEAAANFTPVPYDLPIQQAPHSTAMHPLTQQPPVTHHSPAATLIGQQPYQSGISLSSQRLPSASNHHLPSNHHWSNNHHSASNRPHRQHCHDSAPSLTTTASVLAAASMRNIWNSQQQLSFEQPCRTRSGASSDQAIQQ